MEQTLFTCSNGCGTTYTGDLPGVIGQGWIHAQIISGANSILVDVCSTCQPDLVAAAPSLIKGTPALATLFASST